jgi:hypothetical protein
VHGDAAVREEGEEVCVAAQVVAEAVDEDELGFGGAVGLRGVLEGGSTGIALDGNDVPATTWCRGFGR